MSSAISFFAVFLACRFADSSFSVSFLDYLRRILLVLLELISYLELVYVCSP